MAGEFVDPNTTEQAQPSESSPIVITVKPRVLTPREQEIQAAWSYMYDRLKNDLTEAATLEEFMLSYYVLRLYDEQRSISWMWGLGDPPTKEQVYDECIHEGFRKEASRDAKVAKELRPVVDNLEEHPDQIKVALKRVREGSHGFYKYGILAQFPRGVQAESPILGYTPLEQTQASPDTVFFRPTAACVLHAVDDLYKTFRREGFYIPYKTRHQAIEDLRSDERGVNEYMLKKTPEGAVKQSAANYMLVGIQSAYSNEPYVVPVSRFWGRPPR